MAEETGLPDGWEVRRSNTKNLPYYFNPATKDSRWEPPAGTEAEKLKLFMAKFHSSKPLNTEASGNTQGKIRAAHLLVKHANSRRPASWREQKITRTHTDAMDRIKGFEHQINGKQTTLAELAISESDCSSARKGGDLGYFGRGDMQKEFEDAAFGLNKGEMSSVVETASGLHLIQRLD